LTLLTLFTLPKRFAGHIGVIQRNAIGSWKRLGEEVEIILCGDEAGVKEVATELDVRHLPDVECNEYGTPLVNSAFHIARAAGQAPFLAYVNADIILFRDFVEAATRVPATHLMAGRRWDVDLREQLGFESDWENSVRRHIENTGVLAEPVAIDYFVFSRHSPLLDLPPFAVGRPRWDNWMLFRARSLRIPVVDATPCVDAVHQRHDYSHVPGGSGSDWRGPEADVNWGLAGETPLMSLHQATHVLTPRGIRPATGRPYLRTRWEMRRVVDGDLERFARAIEPVLGPALRLRRLLMRAR
jgi:hypothetical protein